MAPKVDPIPDDYPRLNPYLILDRCAEAIEFYKDVFGATERMRMPGPDGAVGHAELQFGDSVVMMADASVSPDGKSATQLGGSPVVLCVYVADADAATEKARSRGAKIMREPADQFYGDRSSTFTDPWGQIWSPMQRVENLTPEEIAKRAAEIPPME